MQHLIHCRLANDLHESIIIFDICRLGTLAIRVNYLSSHRAGEMIDDNFDSNSASINVHMEEVEKMSEV